MGARMFKKVSQLNCLLNHKCMKAKVTTRNATNRTSAAVASIRIKALSDLKRWIIFIKNIKFCFFVRFYQTSIIAF